MAADLFHLNGANYLVVVDYFSRYPEVQKLNSTTSNTVITLLKSIFARFGIPETFVSDNGPQFASQSFKDFADTYSFQHVTSSPLFAQSNGQAERTVQTVKKMLRDSNDPYMAILTYRSTPFPWCKRSPAELLMGRRLRGNIPVLTHQLVPDCEIMTNDIKLEAYHLFQITQMYGSHQVNNQPQERSSNQPILHVPTLSILLLVRSDETDSI